MRHDDPRNIRMRSRESTNPPMDKRAKAQIHLENALRELNLALSTLGGKTRNKPKVFPPPYRFLARQYLESIIARLRITVVILATREPWIPTNQQAIFVREYESTREDRC